MQLEPQEQDIVNKIKGVVRTYGLYIGIGLLGGISIVVGWNLYQNWQANKLEQASDVYQRFLLVDQSYNEAASEAEIALLNEESDDTSNYTTIGDTASTASADSATPIGATPASDTSTVVGNITILPEERAAYLKYNLHELAQILREDHPKTPFAGFANLRVAALNAMDGNTTIAIEQLSWVFRTTSSDEIARIAGSLLGRTLTSEQRYDEALAILNSNKMRKVKSYVVSELHGDILAQKGDYENAVLAYQEALELGGNVELLNYKIYILPI